VNESWMGPRKRAVTGEGELWKRGGAKRTSRRVELNSFTKIVSEILKLGRCMSRK